MLERLMIVSLAVASLALAVVAVQAWTRLRTARLQTTPGDHLLHALGASRDGRPTVVTFSTPSCAACHTAQAPAVNHVEQRLGSGNVRVIKVDAARQPDVAKQFGVLTVPSSVVLDPSGRVTAINHGFASSEKLLDQLQTA